jgi:heat shock protein HslJ
MTPTVLKLLSAATLMAAFLQGCSQTGAARDKGASPPPGLNGTAWTLTSLPGIAPMPTPQATLRFEGDRATGSDACNRYGTSFTAADGKLELGPQRVSTQMACPEAASQLAAAFNRVLDDVRAYRIEAGSLLLLNTGGATLAALAAQPDTLAGTAWEVSGYNNGKQAVVSVITGTQLTMEFLADGSLRGSGGCNSFSGGFTAEGNKLAIGRVASTRVACTPPEGRMAQEAAFLDALQTVASAQREADRLELRTASGALAVSARLAAPVKP